MTYETRTYNQIVKENNLISYPEPFGIPEKYAEWVRGRGAHMAPALRARLGDLIRKGEDSVLQNSIWTAMDFHDVLDIEYKIIDLDNIDLLESRYGIDSPSIFLYRNSNEIEREIEQVGGAKIIGNPSSLNIGKEVLHRSSKNINNPIELENTGSVEGIPVAPGALCKTKEEAQRIILLFKKLGKDCIFKDPGGTDGNGITTNFEEVESFPVVVEERLDIDHTMSVQYMNGVLGVMKERDKPEDDNRWRGNTLPYRNGNPENTDKFTREALIYADKFAGILEERFGSKPVIFGLDFAIYKNESDEEEMALLDPNIRMPGNMYLYYQMEVLREAGLEPKFAETALLYENEVPNYNGKELQQHLDELGLGLISYDTSTGQPKGFRLNQNGNPEGIIVVVQDPGTDGGDNLSMISVFGEDEYITKSLIERFKAV
ncbi:hypothetical protein GF362_06510 [Candidatus Dojkabacteria bacterium]|nr:hypothetical protein [Candidatus Dojkabacteria bacterium]